MPQKNRESMNARGTALFSLTPRAFWTWGRGLLGLGFGLISLLVLYVAWTAPSALPVLPAAILGATILLVLFRHPLLNLVTALAGFVLIVSHSEGINILEVLYGLYFLGLIAHWMVTRVFFYREAVFEEPEERALILFIAGITLTFPLTILFGGSMSAAFSEWVALLFLLIYFPVKEAIVRYKDAPKWILLTLVWIGVFVTVRNLLLYRETLHNAEMAWQVARGRVVMNDNLLMVLSVAALVFLTFARKWIHLIPMLGIFLTVFFGLLLTQSRGNWVAFLWGAGAMFVLISNRDRTRFLALVMIGGTVFLGLAMIFFGEYVSLVATGLLNRFASLQTAATQDISLVNRFRESGAALEHIKWNPVLGRGMGVPYPFFDIAHIGTDNDSFIHNGYVSMWYRFGLWGLGLILFIWARAAWAGLKAFRMRHAEPLVRYGGLAAFTCLFALTLTTITSNPLMLKDATLTFGVLLGLAGGAWERANQAIAP